MLASPPVMNQGNDHRKRALAKLMQQYMMNQQRGAGIGALGASGRNGGLLAGMRRSPIARMLQNGRSFGQGMGAQGGMYNERVGDGDFSTPFSRAPGRVSPMAGNPIPHIGSPVPPQAIYEGLLPGQTAGGSSALGTPGTPSFEQARPGGQYVEDRNSGGGYTDTVSFQAAPSEWIPLGNGLYYNPQTEAVRGMATPPTGSAARGR
jgi:hypothetical protein